jgi:hypothetical protein
MYCDLHIGRSVDLDRGPVVRYGGYVAVVKTMGGAAVVRGVRGVSERSADTDPAATLDRTSLVFTHAAPNARILTGLKRPLEARIDNRATPAHRLGLLDLQ